MKAVSHTYHYLAYHFVFATKNREPIIPKSIHEPLFAHMAAILRAEGAACLKINGMPDHIHMLARLKTTHNVADIIRAVKSETTGRLRQERGMGHFGWQIGYGAFTVSHSAIEAVRIYIETQEQHHGTTGLNEEFLALCRENGIEIDEASMWD
ncbi:MAG: IS200/IS605 family transposase [Gemmataceae bacterium]|nr:IS200/IS605 family transposase [Gemmataceae bacterium]